MLKYGYHQLSVGVLSHLYKYINYFKVVTRCLLTRYYNNLNLAMTLYQTRLLYVLQLEISIWVLSREIFHELAYSNFSTGKIFMNHQEHLVINGFSKHFKGNFYKWPLICETRDSPQKKPLFSNIATYCIAIHCRKQTTMYLLMQLHVEINLRTFRFQYYYFYFLAKCVASIYTIQSIHTYLHM